MENFSDYSPTGSTYYGDYDVHRESPRPRLSSAVYPKRRTVRVIQPTVLKARWTATSEEDGQLEKSFKRLATAMDRKYGATAFFRDIASCEEHLAIIGLGPQVVPILLADIERNGRPWFIALRAITREKVGDDVEPGNLRALAAAWIKWGKSNDLL